MKRFSILVCILVTVFISGNVIGQNFSYSVKKIWDNGQYNAFTSIEKFHDEYFIVFREAHGHVFDEDGEARGKIRILKSKDGESWYSTAVLSKEGYDLRDPKLSVTPDGKLMVIMGGAVYVNKVLTRSQPQVSFCEDGEIFSSPQPIEIDRKFRTDFDWIWRVTWHDGVGYGVNYSKENHHQLMKTTDGIHYSQITEFDIPDFPNESTVRFLSDGRMAILIRRDAGKGTAYWGTSRYPFTEWELKEMEFHLGGPDFYVTEDGRIICGGRSHYIKSSPRTVLYSGNDRGVFHEAFVLPSSGDNSYPGFLRVGNELWISYYSCHTTKWPTIYLAKISVELFEKVE